MKESTMKKVLNVGGNSKAIPLPEQYADFEHLLLDIDPLGKPDIVCDARQLHTLEAQSIDAIYNSHNLEHYFRHEVPRVLKGFLHVLKEGGFAEIRVPNIQAVMQAVIERNLDIDDVLYESAAGPIMVVDVLYGFGKQIEESGVDFYAHKTGFTPKSLIKVINAVGFSNTYSAVGGLDIRVLAFKGKPNSEYLELFGLSQS